MSSEAYWRVKMSINRNERSMSAEQVKRTGYRLRRTCLFLTRTNEGLYL